MRMRFGCATLRRGRFGVHLDPCATHSPTDGLLCGVRALLQLCLSGVLANLATSGAHAPPGRVQLPAAPSVAVPRIQRPCLAQRQLCIAIGSGSILPLCSAQSSQSDWSSAAHVCLSVCLCAAVEKEHIVDSGGLAALLGLTDASDVRTTARLAATMQALA